MKTTVPRGCETMVHETDTARLRHEILVGLLIGIANGREIFALVQDAADSPAALAILRERRFGVPDDVRGRASSLSDSEFSAA
jgi:hypothetical protein